MAVIMQDVVCGNSYLSLGLAGEARLSASPLWDAACGRWAFCRCVAIADVCPNAQQCQHLPIYFC